MDMPQNLPIYRRLAYGVGHVLNDLCASIWFSYFILYFHYVVRFSNSLAGNLMLLGQVADAIATPLVGLESDRTNGFCKYGKRKSWHLLGTLCVMASFPFIFMLCISCEHSADWAKFIYYAPFVIIFQFGWASTQISHLSLIPALTPCSNIRVELNAIRYAFTVIANLTVYLLTWLLLSVEMNHTMTPNMEAAPTSIPMVTTTNATLLTTPSSSAETGIEPKDAPRFRLLAYSVIGIGVLFNIVFHVGTREGNRNQEALGDVNDNATLIDDKGKMTWRDWLAEPQFYQVAMLYMCTRLVVNVSQVYLPMFLTDSLYLPRQFIAIAPLVVYLSGFLASFVMKPINALIGRKVTFLMGAACIAGNCVWLYFLKCESYWQILGPTILLGVGGSTLLVTSLSMTADLIGTHTESSAFVYGAMSFTDKLSNGVVVVVIQQLHPCRMEVCCKACEWYYRYTISYVPGAMAIMGMLTLLTILPMSIGSLRSHKRYQAAMYGDTRQASEESTEGSTVSCSIQRCFGTSTDTLAKDGSTSARRNSVV